MLDPIGIRVRGPDGRGTFVELFGEFDIACLKTLEEVLSNAIRSKQPVFVDLSGITFLDASCARELAVQYQLHPKHLVLCTPSPQVKLSLAACDLQDWIGFHPQKGPDTIEDLPPMVPERHSDRRGPRGKEAKEEWLATSTATDPAFWLMDPIASEGDGAETK